MRQRGDAQRRQGRRPQQHAPPADDGEGTRHSAILPLPKSALCIRWARPRDCGSPAVHWRIVGHVGTIQHEELAVASDPQLRSARLPSQKQVIELLDGEFARAGYEIEDVVIDGDARPPRITVIADGDEGLDLDSIAALSRSASELLDTVDSSKYRDAVRPRGDLTGCGPAAHRGEALPAGPRPQGRADAVRRFAADRQARRDPRRHGLPRGARRGQGGTTPFANCRLSGIAKAVVQVEFSTPNQRELELAGQPGKGAGA